MDPLAEPQSRAPWRRALVRLALSAAVLWLCALLLRSMDLRKVWQAMRGASPGLLGAALLLNVTVNLWARAERLYAILTPLPHRLKANRRALAAFQLMSYAANNLLPARAGEALRTVELNQRHGYTVGALVAAQLIEKLVEATSMALWALLVGALWPPPSARMQGAMLGFAGATVALVTLLLVLLRPRAGGAPLEEVVPSGWLRALLARLVSAMRLLRQRRPLVRALLWSALSDLTDVLMLGLCLLAVGVHLGVAQWFVVFVVINLAIAVPSTPGQLGVLEAGAVLVLMALGVGQPEALAFALLYHAVHVLPTTVLGVALWGLWRRGR